MRTRILWLSLCLPTLLLADHVVLTNGDTLTGTVVKKDGDHLTLKSDVFGEVSIPWKSIKSLTSDEPLVVVLPGGETVKGKVNTSGDKITVEAPSGEKTAPLADVSAVRNAAEQVAWERVQHPRFYQLWTGFYDFGLALVRGNARTTTLTNSFVATRTTKADQVMVHFNQVYGNALVNNVEATTASAVMGGWGYNRNVHHNLFISMNNDYEHDQFQNLSLRAVVGGGVGWNAIKTDRAVLSVLAGGDYEFEKFEDLTQRNSGEANFGDDFLYRFSKVTSVTQSFRMYPNLSETGEYRANFDLSAVTQIKKWLAWHLTASDRYLSNPVAGRLRNDVLLSTGFRVILSK